MQTTAEIKQTLKNTGEKQNKYLTFSLDQEEYGLEILKVRGIESLLSITKVPKMPDYIKGVINLRGKVIPIIDLRLKFSMDAIDYTDRTCIIVVEIHGKKDMVIMGIIVDKVLEVLNINAEDVEEKVNFGTRIKTDYILGIAKAKDGVKILLDIDKVLTTEELDIISNVTKS